MPICFTKAARSLTAAMLCLLSPVAIQASVTADPISVSGLPQAVVPDGFGVNIHFTHFTPQGLERFKESGFHVARMDLTWGGIEQQKGVYTFTEFDRLMNDLASVDARPLLILDYTNQYYDNNIPPYTDAGRAGFAAYAAAAAAHYKDDHVIWEIMNEPNLARWLPATDPNNWKANSNVDSYIALVKATVPAILKADPNATILAGCTSAVPLDYIEAILRSGAMKGCSAFSVHPYRNNNPETAAADYDSVRTLIARYTPPGQPLLPIVSSEWGYSSSNVSEQKQAAYTIREYLGNVVAGVNTSIFYDWQNDGPDTSNPEWRYGMINQDYTPKPAFLAVQSFNDAMRGYRFCHRLKTDSDSDYKLLFQGPDGLATVAWTATDTDPNPPLPTIQKIAPSDPEYKQLAYAASISYSPDTRVALTTSKVPVTIDVTSPFDTPATIAVTTARTQKMLKVAPHASITKSIPVIVDTALSGTHPVDLAFSWNGDSVSDLRPPSALTASAFDVTPSAKGPDLAVAVTNTLPKAFNGKIVYHSTAGKWMAQPIALAPQDTKTVLFANAAGDAGQLQVVDHAGAVWGRAIAFRYVADTHWPATVSQASPYTAVSYLNNNAVSHNSSDVVPMDADAPAPVAIGVPYADVAAWRYDTLEPIANDPIPTGAKALLVWVKADGSGIFYRARFLDDTGQTFQPEGGRLNDPGWHLVTLALDGSTGIHWGGANDGVPHGQLYWSDFALIDGHGGLLPDHNGTLYLALPSYALP